MSKSFYIPEELAKKIQEEARLRERSVSAIVRRALEKYLDRERRVVDEI